MCVIFLVQLGLINRGRFLLGKVCIRVMDMWNSGFKLVWYWGLELGCVNITEAKSPNLIATATLAKSHKSPKPWTPKPAETKSCRSQKIQKPQKPSFLLSFLPAFFPCFLPSFLPFFPATEAKSRTN